MSGANRLKEAREKVKVNPVCSTISTAIAMIFPISMIAMGALYLYVCPAERYIPIYLLVNGAFICLFLLLSLMSTWTQDEEGKSPVVFRVLNIPVALFLLAWFIAGNVWVYGLHGKYSTSPTAVNYCNNTLYLFAFWSITITYILIGLFLIICCLCCVCLCCVSKKVAQQQE